jgi:hypothetical protein
LEILQRLQAPFLFICLFCSFVLIYIDNRRWTDARLKDPEHEHVWCDCVDCPPLIGLF